VEGGSGVQQTSIDAFYSITPAKLRQRQQEVFDVIKNANGPICDKAIARILGHPINCVTARRNELVKKELVRKAYRRKYPTNDPKACAVIHWEVWK